jgi:hypothetical protein
MPEDEGRMGPRFLIDTNILIYYAQDSIPQIPGIDIDAVFDTSFNLSTISAIEYLGWRRFTDEQFERAVSFVATANTIYVDEGIASIAVSIKRKISIKLPDAIIAATCLGGGYTLLTRNVADFGKIDGLSILNPFDET